LPTRTLDVNGSINAQTFLTSGNVYSTNITSTNLVSSNVSSGTIFASNSLNVTGNASFLSNINGIPPSFIIRNDNTNGNAFSILTVGAGTQLFMNSISRIGDGGVNTATLRNDLGALRLQSSNLTGGILLNTTGVIITDNVTVNGSISTGSIFSNNASITNIIHTNNTSTSINATYITVGNIISTGITSGTALFNNLKSTTLTSDSITTPSLLSTTSTLSNIISTNISSSTLNITNQFVTNISSGILNATGITAQNINFTGSLYQNGSLYNSSQWTTFGNDISYTKGNIGINTTSPSFTLDVNGNTRIQSTTFSTNSTTAALVLLGGISITGTNASSNTNGGALTVNGGTGISGNVYVGGELFIKGINASLITGNQLIGSNTSTGTYQVSIALPRTMIANNYGVIGNLTSISSHTAVFSVSFCNLTTTSITANIMRLDALMAGWNITDLVLSYAIYP